jgi:transposase
MCTRATERSYLSPPRAPINLRSPRRSAWRQRRSLAGTFSAGRIAALLIQGPPELSQPQRTYLQGFIGFCPEVVRLCSLAVQFRGMLRWRNAQLLEPWLRRARSSGLPNVAHYAKRLARDFDAVKLSISIPWNNGPIEGQINRFKVIKLQIYGRAELALLRARVLPFVEPVAGHG